MCELLRESGLAKAIDSELSLKGSSESLMACVKSGHYHRSHLAPLGWSELQQNPVQGWQARRAVRGRESWLLQPLVMYPTYSISMLTSAHHFSNMIERCLLLVYWKEAFR